MANVNVPLPEDLYERLKQLAENDVPCPHVT